MQVEILEDSTRQIQATKQGQTKTHRFQECFIYWTGQKHPRPATVYVPADKQFYQPGMYELDVEKTLRIRNDRLEIDTLVLKPITIDNSGGGIRRDAPSATKN